MSSPRALVLFRLSFGLVFLLLILQSVPVEAAGYSLRFYGNGVDAPDQDRVKIRIDGPGRPADVGATDFTLEWWMKARLSENSSTGCTSGGDNWINGNIMFDRDIYGTGDFGDYGVSLYGGIIAFGVDRLGSGNTICGLTGVADGAWHHIAVTRKSSTGQLRIFVDGVLDAQGDGPSGDVSYHDGRSTAHPNDPFLVIGAEKHDAGPAYPSFSGWIDEVRLSKIVRYTGNFTRLSQPFTPDANTVALYHFDEGTGNSISDSSGAQGGPSSGTRKYGGSPAGPEWSSITTQLSGLPAIFLKEVAADLTGPVAITHAGDGSGRLFITLQSGQIVIHDGTKILPTPFLDLTSPPPSLVSCCGERGLLSVAFHPDYPATPFFYVYYTNTGGDIVIARYTVSANPNVANRDSALILLTIPHPGQANHNGGQLQFGPDGYLYIGTGDGGSGGDPNNNAQNLNSLLGKMLRIDVDGGPLYGIPGNNPFVEDPIDDPNTRGEIWALGLRNPWRFSFDRVTGDLFIGDVGQGAWEEVNFRPASSTGGENYEWSCREGNHTYNSNRTCNTGVSIPPIFEYDHSVPPCSSITGGYRYRGSLFPQFYGVYFYADYCSGRIWAATQNGSGGWTAALHYDAPFFISSFGEDQAGNLYLADHSNGIIYMVTATMDPSPPEIIIGQGPGGQNLVGTTTAQGLDIFASAATSQGINVAVGDLDGDGLADYVVGDGPGGQNMVRVYSGATGALLSSFGMWAGTSGVTVAVGKVTGDGIPRIIAGQGPGGNNYYAVMSLNGTFLRGGQAFATGDGQGISVAAGDVDGDGIDDYVLGQGPQGRNIIAIYSGATGAVLNAFITWPGTTGVTVAIGNVTGDGLKRVVVGQGPGGNNYYAVVTVSGGFLRGGQAFTAGNGQGISVAVGDLDSDGFDDYVVGQGPGGSNIVAIYSGKTGAILSAFYAFAPGTTGVTVAIGNVVP